MGSSVIDDYDLLLSTSEMDYYDTLKPLPEEVIPQRVYRRVVEVPSLGFRGKTSHTHGPFLDLFDRQVFLDVFRPISGTAHSFLPASPYLYMAAPVVGSALFQQTFGAGMVWLRAEWFTRQSSADHRPSSSAYIGFDIVSAVLLSRPTLPPTRTLTLKLDGTAIGSNLFSVNPITEMTVQFHATGSVGKVTALNSGSFSVLGSSFSYTYEGTIQSRQSSLNFKLNTDSSTLEPSAASLLVDFSGACSVTDVSWCVPYQLVTDNRFYAPQPHTFVLALDTGLQLGVQGDSYPTELGRCAVNFSAQRLEITGWQGQRTSQKPQDIRLRSAAPTYMATVGSVTIRRPKLIDVSESVGSIIFSYISLSEGSESWTMNMDIDIALDQPRNVNNERSPFQSTTYSDNRRNLVSWIRDGRSNLMALKVNAYSTLDRTLTSYALKNVLMKAEIPRVIEIYGTYDQGVVVSGNARILSRLKYTVPLLPDPYATNFEIGVDAEAEKIGVGHVLMSSSWTPETVSALSVTLLSPKFTDAKVTSRISFGSDGGRNDDPNFLGPAFYDPSVITKELQAGLIPDIGVGQWYHTPIRGRYYHPPTLLDVSSNGSQFGIIFATRAPTAVAQANPQVLLVPQYRSQEFTIEDLTVYGTNDNVRVMALPATHWEPLITDNSYKYQFTYSGPSTQVALSKTPVSVLMPMTPNGAIESLIGAHKAPQVATLATRLSLPFGMVGTAVMPNTPSFLSPPAKVDMIEFGLDHRDPSSEGLPSALQPQVQLRFRAPRTRMILPGPGSGLLSDSMSFDGVSTLLKFRPGATKRGPNGETVPDDGTKDILGDAADAFLRDMAGQVPLTRFDVSGYGASIFSDWRRVAASDLSISRVLMNVMNGRTSREVIVLDTVMAPFAVKVKQTTEIKRLNNGVVVRHIADWQATSDGRYKYQNTDIVTYVGVVRGVTNVRNIRAIAPAFQAPGTEVEVVLTKYDCVLEIEDGGKVRQVPATDLDGCIFTGSGDLKGQTGKENYMKVLRTLDLGGKTDITVRIGTSGQKKRITSLSVQSSTNPANGVRAAVAAAWGSPIFEGGGQWSFAKMDASEMLPQLVDAAKGVPLVREILHNVPIPDSIATPFQFRDPEQLLTSNPSTLYGIVHGAASHRIMFTDPHIPLASDIKEIVPKEVWLADSFALGKMTGIFPAVADCLPIASNLDQADLVKQSLQILEGGYAFEPKKIIGGVVQGLDIDLPDLERALSDDASVKTVVQTVQNLVRPGQEALADAKSSVNLVINTANNISKMDLTNINLVTHTVSSTTQEASRLVGRLSSDVNKLGGLLGKDINLPGLPDTDPAKLLASPIHTFGPALQPIQKVISFLENLKFLPHFKVSMTNEWAMMMSTAMNREDLLKKIPAPSRPVVDKFIESFDFSLSSRTSLSSFLLTLHVGTTIKIPTGFPPIVALAKGAFDVALGTAGIEIKLDIGFGVGVDFSLGPFHVSASYTQSQTIIFNADHWGVGVTACMRAHIDLVVASADLYLEASLLLVGGDCKKEIHDNAEKPHERATIFGFAHVRVAVHVSIFLICNISVDEEAHWENNFNGGPCQLEHMSDLPK
ncbi:hypothetical protein CC86DRAFT_10763 [Ophiobolus disseminans]|uniref:Uncharacterized protein n=1 Tax=Ophiobolus disseminans TaxID=1469910 RepID=A0A6A7AL79_9PLEO|nr:hypothetical protein CC86DRAFT_10763 [Ophiobolus disseminans]